MARLDELAPDQRAVLQLLLKQDKTYEELASLLRIDADAVRERAIGALEALGPRVGADLDEDRRAEIADYLLGQQSASGRQDTRELLEDSAPGRAWARAVAAELRPVAGDLLPDIPAEGAEVDEAFGALSARQARRAEAETSSRRGGLLLLGALALAIAGVIILLATSGGSSSSSSSDSVGGSSLNTTPPTSSTTSTTSTQPSITAQVNLVPPGGTPANRLGVARLLEQNGQRVLAVDAQGLPPNTPRLAYGMWVTGGPTGQSFLGYPQSAVAKNGRLAFAAALSTDITKYKTLLLTRESATAKTLPKSPGQIVLSGAIKAASGG
jgi:hypothetical protein